MRTKFNLAMFLTGFAMTLHADSSQRGFTVSLRDCTELIGLGPVDFAKARSLVPISYSLVPFNGSAGLVVGHRVARELAWIVRQRNRPSLPKSA
jgi:hypothetical protein